MVYAKVTHLMVHLFVTSSDFSLIHLIQTNDRPRSLVGLWHTTLALGGLRIPTSVPVSGSETGCRTPEAPTIFYCIFKVRFRYKSIFSSFLNPPLAGGGEYRPPP